MKTIHALARFLLVCAASLAAMQARAATIEYVSGDDQAAVVDTFYAQPWVVRVAPFETVRFGSFMQGGVTFDGVDPAYVTADASGLATSPLPRASSIVGHNIGYALADASGWTFFDYTNLSAGGRTAVLVEPLEQSVAIGYQTLLPFTGKVLGTDGKGIAGVPYTFDTNESCGNFDGAATFSAVTDAEGLAVSPRYSAIGNPEACGWSLAFEGADPALLRRPIHVYSLASVVVTVNPNAAAAVSGQVFTTTVSFTADGIPIQVPPGVQVTIGADHNGASASRYGESLYAIGSDSFVAGFLPNDMNGDYDIVVSVPGGGSATIAVTQRKKAK